MSITDILHRQRPAAVPAVDDSLFDTAALVFTVRKSVDAPVEAVWQAIDDDHAWEWLPFPGVGVRYDSPERGVGTVREMGSVHGIVRALWVEREEFWRYEPLRRITFGVISGTWLQALLVRQYGENMAFTPNQSGGTDIEWTMAVTPRLVLRFATADAAAPIWRFAYRTVGIGPVFDHRVRELQAQRRREVKRASTNGHSIRRPRPNETAARK